MNKTTEANFLPQGFEAIKQKPRILIIDKDRDFTCAAKVGLETQV